MTDNRKSALRLAARVVPGGIRKHVFRRSFRNLCEQMSTTATDTIDGR